MNRADRLGQNISGFLGDPSQRVIRSDAEWSLYAKLALESYSGSAGEPEILRKAAFLEAYAANFPSTVDEGQLLAGSRKIGQPAAKLTAEQLPSTGTGGNLGHIIIDYGMVLREGLDALSARVKSYLSSGDKRRKMNRGAYLRSLSAFSKYISRHAEAAGKLAENEKDGKRKEELLEISRVCANISASPARSFHEALQLVWFTHAFLFAEGCAAAFSFGRFDQFAWPYLKKDLESGVIDMSKAEDLVSCFWFKCCEGCESQNLTLGGVNPEGRRAENPLSLLCLKVAADLGLHQPSVTVGISPDSSDEFWGASIKLFSKGFGMPSFVSSDMVVEMLLSCGVPIERARDWGIVGCFEPTTQGDSGAFTVASGVSLVDPFRSFFDVGRPYADFQSFLVAFKDSLRAAFPDLLRQWNKQWQAIGSNNPSPFESVCLSGCIESGLAAEEGGSRYPFFGVDIMGFGTLIDSLQAVRELVYAKRAMSIDELRRQVAENFPDESSRQACLNIAGRYGSDSPDSNKLAEDLSNLLGGLFKNVKLDDGRTSLYPGLFWFGQDIMNESIPATPDGRRCGEACSYGSGPRASGNHVSPTAALNSVAHVNHALFPNGTPLIFSFNRTDINGKNGLKNFQAMIGTFFKNGGFQIQGNLLDAGRLRKAQANPGAATDVIVRVSGFSAKFTAMPKRWQNILIERVEQGL